MSDPLLVVSHLHQSVTDATGTLDILCDIDFSVMAGETLAIVGSSGSGKSTLLSLMAGLDTPSQGTVWVQDLDLFDLDEDGRARARSQSMGFVFQSFQLLSHLTALENVMLPLELAGRPNARLLATEMLQRVGLGVPDVARAVAELKARGVEFVESERLHPEDRGALTRNLLGSVGFELVHR